MAILGGVIGKRRLRVVYLLGSLLALAASLHAPTAYAAAGDPPIGSPAGAVYALPLEQGRAEGAPKGRDGTAAGEGGAAQGESGSLYRSENNFGSSSHVPGVAVGGGGGSGGGPTSGGGGAAGGGGPLPGGGGAAGAAGAAVGGAALAAGAAADSGNTSVPGSIVLLAAIALLAAAVGVLSRRFARGRAEPTH